MTGPSNQKLPHIYFENLDALRFLAAFSVFIFHFTNEVRGWFPHLNEHGWFDKVHTVTDKGALGVNFFFVLSGFLITYLILHEKKYKGHFELGKFLIRRTLRIWPLYYLVVVIGFVIFPLVINGYHTDHDPWMYVSFLANFDEIKHGLDDPINFLTATWSVAVEEQFYLFWGPALFLLFRIRSIRTPHLIILLYLISFAFRWVYMDDHRLLYYHTIAVCQDILTGAFIGWSLFQGKKWLDQLRSLTKVSVISIYFLGFALCILKNKIFINEWIVLERFVLSGFFAFVILDQIRGKGSFFKFGKITAFNYLGKISYGLYMYHLIVLYLLLDMVNNWEISMTASIVIFGLMSFALTVGIASLSYYLLERPLLKLKPK